MVGYSRGDAEVRALRRACEAEPSPALLAKLKAYELRGPWEPACFEFHGDSYDKLDKHEREQHEIAVVLKMPADVKGTFFRDVYP